MENKDYIQQLEQRIIDLERRFFPIERVLYEVPEFKDRIALYKQEAIDRDGFPFCVECTIETDKGSKVIQLNVKAYTEKQAFWQANQIVYEQMCKVKESGKISWFKTVEKKCV